MIFTNQHIFLESDTIFLITYYTLLISLSKLMTHNIVYKNKLGAIEIV